MKKMMIVAAAVSLLGIVGTVQAGDAAAGKAKAAACAGCHGADGNSMVPMYPKLAGQHAAYLVKALKSYQSGARSDPTMKAMAAPLSAADIDNLAAYFSSESAK